TAIIDTKTDMEQPQPMDRLICGDVGFGKTEVAIRAAFKAVMDGKQVAVLAPTTVLAQQHFETFRQRMLDYPIRIEMLSRFRSPAEQKKILQLLREGGVDIVIGTHRLISGDVLFKDLGLVVIDEVRDRVAELCLDARVEFGHGQMDSDELEAVMHRFVMGNIDVLVCTTIIESGLDIPNANTIIIDRADRFGLADLYQLRGRVGRAEHKAYAYLLFPREMMAVGAAS